MKVSSQIKSDDYDFIEKPVKIPWNKDVSYRFENLLQSDDYKKEFGNFLTKQIDYDQGAIDSATLKLSELLTTAAWEANTLKLSNMRKVDKTAGSRRKGNNYKSVHPKWHDQSCAEAHKSLMTTSKFFKSDPKNSYLRGKLQTETKFYNRLVKSKHKEFVDKMFAELDSLENADPRGYMQLVKSMRDGNYDKATPDDTSGVSPGDWHEHFSKLLSKPIDNTRTDHLKEFINNNVESLKTKMDNPITPTELDLALNGLKNNKASSFDKISNEILKTSGKVYKDVFLHLFNAIGKTCFYPNSWKQDVLHPIHKSNEKDDPNNFRGISIASCFGKLYIKILKNRLQDFIDEKKCLSKNQGSGRKLSRTSDHLMVIKFFIDKIVKSGNTKLYTCFVDVKKAYDCTLRELLWCKLLTEYGVGGNFLKTLQSMYDGHQVYVRLSGGLLQPIATTVGLKQGCGISPLLFNMFIDKITTVFDDTCDPLSLGGEKLSCLLWADDLVLLSSSPEGLQKCIDKTFAFYNDLGLEINTKKNKVVIFIKRGIKITDNVFLAGGETIEIVDNYQYLGVKLRASGSLKFAVGELFDKANKAWFSISNVLYQHKKLPVKKALQLFDSLIRPIFLYASEFWLPFLIPKKGFGDLKSMLKSWESFQPEILNQKVCRMLLSVHKRCSRLAVLGELGRYPTMIPALKLCLKYQYQLDNGDRTSFVYKAMQDMKNDPDLDCWYSRVDKIKINLNIRKLYGKSDKVGKTLDKLIKSKFDRFYLDEINLVKIGLDGNDHNKLRLYKTLKGSFKQEPYIYNVKNRNQRAWLSRYRTSAHNLRVETGRYTSPVTPLNLRVCVYCTSGECDNETHAILCCDTFKIKRQCFFGRMSALSPDFLSISTEAQLKTLLCPANTEIAKCVSKYLGIISLTRKEIDLGLKPERLELYVEHKSELAK